MRTCVIKIETGLVENVIELGLPAFDDHSASNIKEDTAPPEGFLWVAHPEASFGWSYAGGVFTPPPQAPLTLEQKVLGVEMARDAALEGAVTWNGRQWHMDDTFTAQLTGLIMAHTAGIVPDAMTHPIRTYDNLTVQLGIADLKALAGVVLAAVQQIWQASFSEKDALQASVPVPAPAPVTQGVPAQ